MSVLKGFIPLLFYSAMFITAPLVYIYTTPDYTDAMVRGVVIGIAGIYALSVVVANDCVAWFNMVLFFHIGMEVKVLDILMNFATEEGSIANSTLVNSTTTGGTSDGDTVLSWIGFVVVAVHLIPFLIINNTMLLTLLAFTGVIVNAAVLVYLDTSLLLIVGFSSAALLGTTLCIGGVCGIQTSLLCAFTKALKDGSWVTCSGYQV